MLYIKIKCRGNGVLNGILKSDIKCKWSINFNFLIDRVWVEYRCYNLIRYNYINFNDFRYLFVLVFFISVDGWYFVVFWFFIFCFVMKVVFVRIILELLN